MKNKKVIKFLFTFLGIAGFYACSKSFLDVTPQGSLDLPTLSTSKGVEKLLIGAYAMLDGEDGTLQIGTTIWGGGGSNYVFGSMAGGDANRGSTPQDQGPNMTNAIRHESAPLNLALNEDWIGHYEGINRCNTTLQALAGVQIIDPVQKVNIAAQARFLRGWYHFQLRILFGRVPYINEFTADSLQKGIITSLPNNTDIFPNIEEDLQFAYDNLPELQDAVGRANKWTAGAVLGKVLMFMHDYANAKTVLDDVVANGKNSLGVKYALNANYYDNFDVDKENSSETVLDFQSSSLDNAAARNANWGDQLNTPAGVTGGAGFHTPTFWFTNRFKTDAAGQPVPYAAAENNVVLDPAGTSAATGAAPGYTQYNGNVDVRLDYTVGRNGVPFLDWGMYTTSWRRDPSAGPFAGKKIMIRQSQTAASHDASVWFVSGGNALNIHLLRFSDVLLLDAEADIETGDLGTAFTLINQVRARAQGTPKVVYDYATYGTPMTAPYTAPFADAAAARVAVKLERVLELGMEGHRFFDLVRWGDAETELTNFYNYESAIPYQTNGDLLPKPTYTSSAQDYYAIPQQQIDLSHGMITQNP